MTNTKTKLLFIITTLAIFPLPQLAIDLYLPSLPAMATTLHTSKYLLQLSLTIYILMLGFAQLVYGPFSDRFGRKPVLLVGITIFLIGSIACTFSTSITQILLCRALQGAGMGCGFTVASAILGDAFKGAELAKMTTFSSMIYASSPIFAPVLGGYLQQYIGWQANFVFMAIFGILLLLCVWFFVPETNTNLNLHALKPKSLLFNYLRMFKNLQFIGCVITLTLAFGIMITFNVIGPFLLQNILHVSAVNYGKLLLLVGASYLAGTALNSRLLKYYKVSSLIWFGLILGGLSCVAIFASVWLAWLTVTSVILWTCIAIFSTGFVFPNAFAIALEVFPNNLGAATALIGSSALIGTALISIIIAQTHAVNELSLGNMFLAQIILGVLCFWMAQQFRKQRAAAHQTIN